MILCVTSNEFHFNPNLHKGGHFYTLVLLGLDFVSGISIKHFKTFGGENGHQSGSRKFDNLLRSLSQSYKKSPQLALKMSIFLAFRAHANEG